MGSQIIRRARLEGHWVHSNGEKPLKKLFIYWKLKVKSICLFLKYTKTLPVLQPKTHVPRRELIFDSLIISHLQLKPYICMCIFLFVLAKAWCLPLVLFLDHQNSSSQYFQLKKNSMWSGFNLRETAYNVVQCKVKRYNHRMSRIFFEFL